MKLKQGGLFRSVLLLAVLTSSTYIGVSAQTKKVPLPISAGVVNGKALTLPKPVYPENALKAKLSGSVSVQVLIDETGRIISAKAVSGLENVSLRIAAENAALKAIFSPTLLKGQPAKVSGVIVYNFAAEKSNEEKLRVFSVAAYLTIVRTFAPDLDKFKDALDEKELFKNDEEDFGDFAPVLKSLESMEKLPVNKRLEAVDYALSLVRAKLTDSDRWQYEVGKNLGEILGPIMWLMASSNDPDISKLDGASIKLNLNKISDLTLSTPPDFPADVLAKLKVFAAIGVKDKLSTRENLLELIDKMGALIEVVSLGATK